MPHEYQRIADVLLGRIKDGTYGPGDQLPTQPELEEEFEVSPTTVRNALALLRAKGLIESRTRAGTRVLRKPTVHRMGADRYRPREEPSTAFTIDQQTDWSEYHLEKRFERVRADAEIAALFEEEPGLPLLARHFVFHDGGEPQQMSTSYVRWADVRGTPVADPINEPWPGGTRAQMASLGITVDQIKEEFTAAMPTEEERRVLRLGEGVPVLRWTRRMWAGGRVVEAAHPIVRRGDTTVVEAIFDL